jgi:tetratricopeptide (TPR) repeat protein
VIIESFLRKRANTLWEEGKQIHLKNQVAEAINLYTKSIDLYPTPEAYTLRGWAYHSLGRTKEAINECKQAIKIDPEYGNPYNDIGSYLIKLESLDEAIEWFKKAKLAPRYEPRHFPYINLGRIYAAKGLTNHAICEFEGALIFQPGEASCLAALKVLKSDL